MARQEDDNTKTSKERFLGSNLSVITFTSMIGTFGNGTWTFLMPLYLVIIGVPVVFVGITYTAIAATSSFSPVIGGSLADKFGRKPVILISQLIHVPLMLMMAFYPYPLVVVISLVAWRFTGTMAVPARMTLIAESSGKRGKENAYATWRAMTDAVTISSPLLGGILLYGGHFPVAFVLSAILGAISFATRYRYLRETKHTLTSQSGVFSTIGKGLKDLTSNRLILTLTSVSVVALFLSGMSEYLIPIFSSEILNLGSNYIGLLFSIQVAVTAVVLNPGAVLSKKIGRLNLILVGVVASAIFEVFFAFSLTIIFAFIFFGLWMAFDIMTHPAISAFQYDSVNRERASTDIGSMSTLASLVSIAAPTVGMLLFLSMPRSPFYISSFLMVAVYSVLWLVGRKNRPEKLASSKSYPAE